ncbi:MAG: hypothetical protein EA361_13255 [Bacteroidetes bacterium]|nr:MAG: hypothetical protein EA361_13255 [Bacteroidota bacterium]
MGAAMNSNLRHPMVYDRIIDKELRGCPKAIIWWLSLPKPHLYACRDMQRQGQKNILKSNVQRKKKPKKFLPNDGKKENI